MPFIALSARKQGVSDDDMRHAMRNPIRVFEPDDGFTMFVGPARHGTPIEVGVADSDSGPVVIRAMRARPRFLPREGGR